MSLGLAPIIIIIQKSLNVADFNGTANCLVVNVMRLRLISFPSDVNMTTCNANVVGVYPTTGWLDAAFLFTVRCQYARDLCGLIRCFCVTENHRSSHGMHSTTDTIQSTRTARSEQNEVLYNRYMHSGEWNIRKMETKQCEEATATPRAFNYLIHNFRCHCNRILVFAARECAN